jgi:thymidylate kinase
MKIISFSGIDGAGKSTQIIQLQTWLEDVGIRSKLLTFWDNVVVLSRWREYMSRKAFKGDQGVGTPEKPLQRRDKNVTSPAILALRFLLYLADAINLTVTIRHLRKSGVDVMIFDRYIYDELANLPLNKPWAQGFARLILGLVPKPDAAYVIDADPGAAWARKPEYPREFVFCNRESYLTLARLAGNITVIAPDTVETTATTIRAKTLDALSGVENKLSNAPAFL